MGLRKLDELLYISENLTFVGRIMILDARDLSYLTKGAVCKTVGIDDGCVDSPVGDASRSYL